MFGKKFNDRNDFVLFEFCQRGIPLDEEVCGVDLPIPQNRSKSISSQVDFGSVTNTANAKPRHADWAVVGCDEQGRVGGFERYRAVAVIEW